MAKHQQYAEYKDSGVEWLDVIPMHWVMSKIKYVASFQVGWTPPTGNDSNFIGENIWANISDLRGKVITDTVKRISDKAAKEASMDITPKGSLLYSFKLSVGSVSFAGCDMYTNEAIASFTSDSLLPLEYLYYVLPKFLIENASTNIYGARILNQELIKNAIILKPTYEEAKTIANFLDYQTAQIDTLIDKQQTLIQLLKEKRQAVISHAVTKGLNPDAPMKDSGVEWLGGIPSHWNMQKLKYVGEAKNGLTYSPDNVTEAGIGTLVLRSSNIQNAQLSFEDNVYVDMKIPERILVRTDDILICSRNGSRRLIGKNALITEDVAGQAFGAFMVVFRSEVNTYLYWILNSPLFEYQSGSFLTSTINQLTIGNLHSMEIPIPPKKEQDEIEKYLKTKMIDFDKLISKAEQAIQLMQERRTALISAAVTGKIDVRSWQAPDSDAV